MINKEIAISTEKAMTKEETIVLENGRNTFAKQFFLKKIMPKSITYWEEVTCLGYQPDLGQLEAVVSVKRSNGYNGGLCTNGSTEYLRFFIDWNDGTGFHDVGLTSFKAFDISDNPPGPQHPIKYMVYLTLDDRIRRKCCFSPVLPRVRAILSWQVVPSINPNQIPHYGNRIDASIQIRPKPKSLICILKPPVLKEMAPILVDVDLEAPLPKIKPKPIELENVFTAYKNAEVPDHRTLYPFLAPLISETKQENLLIKQVSLEELEKLGIDASKVFEALSKPLDPANANVTFEQVVCAGLNTANDILGAVIHLKKPLGYSGNLCNSGSQEYVAFWADYNNDGSFDEYLGTAVVNTHDIGAQDFPKDGLYYSIMLGHNFTNRLKSCKQPNIVRIRAVLSWAIPPSTTDPNQLNYWGNRIDVVVQIRPGVASTDLIDLIYTVGNVDISNISSTTFLAIPSTLALDENNCSQAAMDRPFGGRVIVTGRIYNSGPPGTVHFRVEYSEHGANNWKPVTNSETFTLMHPLITDLFYPEQTVPVSSPDGWFPYLEDPTATPPILEQVNRLADWYTGNLEGEYDLRLVYTKDYPITSTSLIHKSKVVSIVVHNKGFTVSPTANNVIDMGYDLDMVIDGGDCHSYEQKDPNQNIIHGHLRAVNDFFWYWTIDLEPSTHTHSTQTTPPCKSYKAINDNGYANEPWQLDITKLDPCGYTATLRAYDRTIIDSNGAIVHSNAKAVGFAVK